MNVTSATFHLDADEKVRVDHRSNHDAVYIEDGRDYVSLILFHSIPAFHRVAFLRALAVAATTLANDIAWQAVSA